MKKSLLLILASLFAIFALSGCAEEEKNDTPAETTPPTVVPIDPANPEALSSLLGYYEITFFHTNGGKTLSISSDCTKVAYYTGSADEKCVQGTNSVEMKGYGEVLLSNDYKYINITTKMQMTNDKFKNPGAEDILWYAGKSSQYNYTVYKPIPVTAIANGAVNDGKNAVTGTTGRNLEKNVSSPTDTYKFELLSDGSIRNTMKNMSATAQLVGGADVTIIMKKIDAIPDDYKMDANTQFPEPVIEGFVADPAASAAQ